MSFPRILIKKHKEEDLSRPASDLYPLGVYKELLSGTSSLHQLIYSGDPTLPDFFAMQLENHIVSYENLIKSVIEINSQNVKAINAIKQTVAHNKAFCAQARETLYTILTRVYDPELHVTLQEMLNDLDTDTPESILNDWNNSFCTGQFPEGVTQMQTDLELSDISILPSLFTINYTQDAYDIVSVADVEALFEKNKEYFNLLLTQHFEVFHLILAAKYKIRSYRMLLQSNLLLLNEYAQVNRESRFCAEQLKGYNKIAVTFNRFFAEARGMALGTIYSEKVYDVRKKRGRSERYDMLNRHLLFNLNHTKELMKYGLIPRDTQQGILIAKINDAAKSKMSKSR